MAEGLKATVVFVCGLNPHPVTKLEDVYSVRVGNVFAPALHGKARLPDNVREYEVDFPIAVADADSEERLEALRKAFHERIDQTFDAYLKKWEEASKMIEKREGKTVSLAEALQKKKDEKEGDGVGDVGVDSGG
jgi:hypothetical protein